MVVPYRGDAPLWIGDGLLIMRPPAVCVRLHLLALFSQLLAKELVMSRNAKNRMYEGKAQLHSVQMQLHNQIGAEKLPPPRTDTSRRSFLIFLCSDPRVEQIGEAHRIVLHTIWNDGDSKYFSQTRFRDM